MTVQLLQDLVVTCGALFAAFVVLRRVFAFVRPGQADGGCASCGPGNKTCATLLQSGPAAGQAQVIHLLRASATAVKRPQLRDRAAR